MSKPIKISVIIPFYNAQRFLKNCLASLGRQDFQSFFEIIMIDDASTDESQKIINECNLSNIRLFKSKIKLLPKRPGERYVSALTNKNLSNKMYRYFGKIKLSDYIKNFIKINS